MALSHSWRGFSLPQFDCQGSDFVQRVGVQFAFPSSEPVLSMLLRGLIDQKSGSAAGVVHLVDGFGCGAEGAVMRFLMVGHS